MKQQITYILIALFLHVTTAATAQDNQFYENIISKGYEIVTIENEGLMKYLDNRAYDDPKVASNYSYSIVRNYSKGQPPRPAGKILKWNAISPVESISSIVVTLVESAVEKDESALNGNTANANVKYYYPDKKSHEYLLCNMIPHMYCYYKVEEVLYDGQRNVLTKGKFYSDGQVRMLRVDGMTNVRDFGGWITTFGKSVVYGRLFRGNRPDGITATGKNDFVKNEHITADLDLRGRNLGKSPLGPLEEVEYYITSNHRYRYALQGHTDVLAKNLNDIASVLRRGGSVFLHCEHGANRAGTLSFVIDGILGFSEADISRDYELSSFAYGLARGKTFGDMLPIIRSYGQPGDDLAQCFYNFARKIGVSEENLDTIRCVMLNLSPDDPIITKAHK